MDTAARFLATAANRFLGTRLIESSPHRTKLELPLSAQFVQEEGVVHGGVIAMLADTASVYLVLPQMQPNQTATSIEFKLNFLSAARPDGAALTAEAVPVKLGRTIAVCECEVRQGTNLVAKGLFTYLIRERT